MAKIKKKVINFKKVKMCCAHPRHFFYSKYFFYSKFSRGILLQSVGILKIHFSNDRLHIEIHGNEISFLISLCDFESVFFIKPG